MHVCSVIQFCFILCNPHTVALQAPPSVGSSRQQYQSRLPFSSPEYLPNEGWNPCLLCLLHWQGILYHKRQQGLEMMFPLTLISRKQYRFSTRGVIDMFLLKYMC